MFGLILKDIYELRKQGKVMLLLLTFYIVYGMMSHSLTMLTYMTFLICTMLSIISMSYDEQCKWDKYALSMPILRKTIVYSKYLLGLLLEFGGVLFIILITLLFVQYTNGNLQDAFNDIALASEVAVLFLSLMLPIVFKFGVEKGRLVMFTVFIIPTIAAFLLSKLNIQTPDEQTLKTLTNLSPVAVIIILLLSVLISVTIYEKKDF